MKNTNWREITRRFHNQHCVIARSELRALGADYHTEQRRLASGEWAKLGRRVVRLADTPVTPEQRLMAACIEAGDGSVASHQSAAWLWGLADQPRRHAVTIPRRANASISWADVHRPTDPPDQVSLRSGIPCTNPLRTLVDLAAVTDEPELDLAIDRALASRLVTVEALVAETDRLARPGRAGVGPIRRALQRRGLVGAPHPSVLESRILRLFHANGIQPTAVEVRMGEDGRYRIDVMITPAFVVEVDGYAYHHTPEQKTEDERRRNRLRLEGVFLLVYTWRDVTRDGRRVIAEVRRVLDARPVVPRLATSR